MGEMMQAEEGEILEEEQKGDVLAEEVVADFAGTADCHPCPVFQFDLPPWRACHFCHQFRNNECSNNFLKGVKWFPDCSCFLTSSDDNNLWLFGLFIFFEFDSE